VLDLRTISEIHRKHQSGFESPVGGFDLAGKTWDWQTRNAIMGVINLSRDSWYRESVCLNTEMALRRARLLAAQGADVIDIGAESSLSHAERVTDSDQLKSLLPVIAGSSELAAVSVETYYPAVAEKCLDAGASILNLTGNVFEGDIYRIAAERDAAVIICFVQGDNVREVGDLSILDSPLPVLRDYFRRATDLARKAGVTRIFIDPGLGFYYRNLQDSAERIHYQSKVFLLAGSLRDLGFPICQALPHAFEFFAEEVRSAEPYFAVLASLGGTSLLRTHEVPKVKAVMQTMACVEPADLLLD
jgi:dihydropteroate synthase